LRYFLDTEFNEEGDAERPTITLISIGIVAEDGRELYAVNENAHPSDCNSWVRTNVWPNLYFGQSFHFSTAWCKEDQEYVGTSKEHPFLSHLAPTEIAAMDGIKLLVNDVQREQYSRSRGEIRNEIEAFIGDDQTPEFWGYFSDYDWVVFCWLWGAMLNLPKNFPKYCLDLKQRAWELGVKPKDLLPACEGEHNALIDARWNRELFAALDACALARKSRP
jgi:hypothetical protein